MAEDAGHGGLEGCPKFKLVETEIPPGRVEDSVVRVHCCHDAASECVSGNEGYGGHGVAGSLLDYWFLGEGKVWKERWRGRFTSANASTTRKDYSPKPFSFSGMFEIQPVGEEFADPGG